MDVEENKWNGKKWNEEVTLHTEMFSSNTGQKYHLPRIFIYGSSSKNVFYYFIKKKQEISVKKVEIFIFHKPRDFSKKSRDIYFS